MLDLSCKNIDLESIIKCSLGLTRSDYNILIYLYKNKRKTYNSEDLSLALNLKLCTIQRSLKILFEKNLLDRSKESIHSRGYNFVYKRRSKEDIKKIILKNIDSWNEKIKNKINHW